jgi:glutathione S-transferase
VKLFYSATSPYARKARVVLREKGLQPEIEESLVNPWGSEDEVAELRAVNPLGKVPALIGPDGENYFDSPVVCAFLDARGSGHPLIPAGGEERFRVLRAEALADGVLDAGVGVLLESRRPPEQQSAAARERSEAAVTRAVAAMSEALPFLPKELTLGHLTMAIALGYLDFRLPYLNWRDSHQGLAAWYSEMAQRPSLKETAPPPA